MTDLEALETLREKVAAGDHRVGMWEALYSPPNPHLPEYARRAYLGNVDAAIALAEAVLPDFGWHVDSPGQAGLSYPWVEGDAITFVAVVAGQPARALLLATLDALIAKEKDDDSPESSGVEP